MAEVKEIIEDENKIETVIAEDIHFRGTLKFKKSLKIKGRFEGKIESEGQVIIGQEATISANIEASTILVNGSVNGKLKANKSIELYKMSSTSGDIISPDLQIEKGAVFNGTCLMPEKK
ncbi:MAG: polymer-forming cytoskeletal protein [Spirochaetes bacterium]|nr:polymer-forming cytoskeletal protein [Spirochaetota bacterium]MBN2771618.1 polymer-forming cytoskeletal protein [Spirochaetota bacterium]HRX15110.1 polymer-forming cytoskeletal protein [Spirochaetota bacterium]